MHREHEGLIDPSYDAHAKRGGCRCIMHHAAASDTILLGPHEELRLLRLEENNICLICLRSFGS